MNQHMQKCKMGNDWLDSSSAEVEMGIYSGSQAEYEPTTILLEKNLKAY